MTKPTILCSKCGSKYRILVYRRPKTYLCAVCCGESVEDRRGSHESLRGL